MTSDPGQLPADRDEPSSTRPNAAERNIHEILLAAAITAAVQELALDLPAATTSPRLARAFVRSVLDADDVELVASVELLVSEVVTNAVVHASSAPHVEVQLSPDYVRVTVSDDDPRLPQQRMPDVDRPGGRGLHLIEQIAARWGVDPTDHGKAVWFEIER